jgi:drug/metabolite transporter (DMT)-like permease
VNGRAIPYVILGIGVLTVSFAAVLVRGADAPALVIAAYRMAFAAIPVGSLALFLRLRSRDPSIGRVFPLMLAGIFLALHFAFWITSLQHTSVVTAVVLVSMQPLFVGLASPFFLGEPVERRVWFGLAVALVGIFLMAAEDVTEGLGTIAGDLFAVLGGLFAAAYLMAGRYARPSTGWLQYVGVVYPISAGLLLAAVFLAGEAFTGYSTKTWLMIVLMALGPQLIGHTSINWALGYLPAVVVAMAILVEPVGATILAALILDEWPSALEWLGSAIILAGVYLALRPERQRGLLETTARAVAD